MREMFQRLADGPSADEERAAQVELNKKYPLPKKQYGKSDDAGDKKLD